MPGSSNYFYTMNPVGFDPNENFSGNCCQGCPGVFPGVLYVTNNNTSSLPVKCGDVYSYDTSLTPGEWTGLYRLNVPGQGQSGVTVTISCPSNGQPWSVQYTIGNPSNPFNPTVLAPIFASSLDCGTTQTFPAPSTSPWDTLIGPTALSD